MRIHMACFSCCHLPAKAVAAAGAMLSTVNALIAMPSALTTFTMRLCGLQEVLKAGGETIIMCMW